ncbi:MAG: hypothetical protein KDA22_15010, partial [Phycisphaerales bacterium]|nr:hypothetical protein [Phycisphaerales bacterium]
ECCETVCAVDAFCCNNSWDGICVGEAAELCGEPGLCPDSDHDCFTEGAPGCTDIECCETVCAVDAFCCNNSWDGICVGEAAELCGEPGSNCCSPNDGVGCDDPTCEAAVCAIDAFCCETAWDGVCAAEAADLCEVCGGGQPGICPESDHDCFTEGGAGCTDVECCETVCAVDLFCCDSSWDGICVDEASELCGQPGLCPDSDHDCFTEGGPGCTDIACCETVCAVDAFCCNTSWDGICVGEATDLCDGQPGVCPASDHDCLTAGAPGCTDLACCEAVCAEDSFCCETMWDELCVNIALEVCDGTGGPSNCCMPNGGIGCDDAACESAVCGIDAFCCKVEWDGICAGEAADLCPNLCP